MNIIQSYVTENQCYKTNKTITPQGLMLHSIGVNQPNAKTLVKNYNSSNLQACVHGFIDANTGDIYQTLPWNHRGWHCGGAANNTHIGVEMCEPSAIKYTSGANFIVLDKIKAEQQVKTAYNSAVELFAYLCKKFNLNPLQDGVIISHKEGHQKGLASNHGDPEHLWKGLNLPYSMAGFKQDVYKKINFQEAKEDIVTQEQFNKMMDNYIAELAKKPPSNWASLEMKWAVNQGLISSASQMPAKFLTREEMAAILHRFKDKFIK